MAKLITTAQAAEMLGTDPKTLRRFIRAGVRNVGGTVGTDTPGRGKRYALDAETVEGWRDAFASWERGGTYVPLSLVIVPPTQDDTDAA